MTNNIGCIGTGLQFRFGKNTYVRIPEMILECGLTGFVVNAIRVEEPPNGDQDIVPPKFIAEFLHPDTMVEILQKDVDDCYQCKCSVCGRIGLGVVGEKCGACGFCKGIMKDDYQCISLIGYRGEI